MNITGIYCIINTITADQYIGSAYNLSRRWSKHQRDLKQNKHHSNKLQNAWNKYSEDAFEFIVLFECDIDSILNWEQRYIDNCKPAYNIALQVKSPGSIRIGCKHSEESKQKISKALTGKVRTEQMKLASSLSRQGSLASEKAREMSAKSKVNRVYSKGKKASQQTKKKISLSRMKPIKAFDIDKQLVHQFASVQEAARFILKSAARLCQMINTNVLYKQYYWEYIC